MNIGTLVRLTGVELYKYFATRSTAWMAGVTVGLIVLVLGIANISAATMGGATSFMMAVTTSSLFLTLLAPISVILIFTSDWGSGEFTTYFAIARKRAALLFAKFAAAAIVFLLFLVATVVIAALTTAIPALFGDVQANWSLDGLTGDSLLSVAVSVLIGCSLATLFMSAAWAITVFLLTVPLVNPLLQLLPHELGRYFQTTSITADWELLPSPLAFVTSLLIWIVVPLAAGAFRFLRREP